MEKIEKLLHEILENQKKFHEKLGGMDERLNNMNERLDSMEQRQQKMEVKLRKQGIIQEKMQRNIELLVEGHKNILETII